LFPPSWKNNKKAEDGQPLALFCAQLTKNFCFGVHDATGCRNSKLPIISSLYVVIRLPNTAAANTTNTTEVVAAADNEDEFKLVTTKWEDPPNGGVGSDIELRLTKSMKREEATAQEKQRAKSPTDDVVIYSLR
jgi:hypothetical protein